MFVTLLENQLIIPKQPGRTNPLYDLCICVTFDPGMLSICNQLNTLTFMCSNILEDGGLKKTH